MKAFTRTLLVTFGLAVSTQADEASKQIDALLAKDWQQHKLTPNSSASDETFVRRVHLDIIGRIPTMQETQSYLKSPDKGKRAKLIDALLASDGYNHHMVHFPHSDGSFLQRSLDQTEDRCAHRSFKDPLGQDRLIAQDRHTPAVR